MDLQELLEKVGKKAEVMLQEQEASKFAKDSFEQLESLVDDDLDKTLQNVTKALGDDSGDLIVYGKAIAIARYITKKHIVHKNLWLVRVLHPKAYKHHLQKYADADQAFENAVTYLTLKRIKRDIMERYELPEAKK